MSRLSPVSFAVFRTLVILGLLALGSGIIGTVFGRLSLRLGAVGETLATGLAVCGGIWALVLLVGMIFVVPQSMMGEYFWLVAPIASGLSIGIGFGVGSDASWTTIAGYTVLGSLLAYGMAVIIHLLVHQLSNRGRA